ncbi:response regulator transcription factor [Sulfurimonas autotrophica]|uniref:Response regulator receiver protein n=1 Tax=Sulfurimonas autotrophica (strain ATCC BAA-671 / DSM 16294 / JCM 11897 / OK10) TaxID=563040 RepID=E0UPV0_SULAO|nr:response regulator transcription factor [Sulfurimonas autotrophica]ADN09759.1 response regulator receiver protein [Sulfurimonas autotrophica DSM 16294]
MKALLVEDDIQLNTTVKKFLQLQNYNIVSIFDGEEAINIIDEERFDVYIIDINLPNISGLEIVKYIRKKDLISPIIIMTASLEVNNFVDAYDNGCSEYIKKPFHLKELQIRMQHLLKNNSSDIFVVNDRIKYDFANEELKIDNATIRLRKKVNRVLQILLKNINHTVKTEEIISYVWENEIKESYPLRQLVADLRKEFNFDKNYIISQPSVGYKFETDSNS